MDTFESREWMKGTSFSLGEDDESFPKTLRDIRSIEDIEDMLEQTRDRMEFYKAQYKRSRKNRDKAGQLSAIRNFKALEGLYFGLKWVLMDPAVEHPLY